jgi:hypothetical protein
VTHDTSLKFFAHRVVHVIDGKVLLIFFYCHVFLHSTLPTRSSTLSQPLSDLWTKLLDEDEEDEEGG